MEEGQFVKQCIVNGDDRGIIPEEITDILSNSIVRIEYKIESSNIISTGFFIKIKINDIDYRFLFTCEHSLKEKDIQTEIEIFLYFGKSKNEKVLKIKLNKKQRFIKKF